MTHRLGIAALVLACSSPSPTGGMPDMRAETPDAGPGVPDAEADAGDPYAPFFDPDHVVEVSVDIAPADWDSLRMQGRTFADLLGANCLSMPHSSPFTWFSADVTVDGVTVHGAGVRKKGFYGSLDTDKPALKIDFGQFTRGQRLSGMKRMTLNNSKQDPSYLHQCLGYALFGRAGIPAERCNFAHVTVNGRDMGVFIHVESVDKAFLKRHYADDRGQLYEGTLSDFRDMWVDTFQVQSGNAMDRSDLQPVVRAVAPSADDAGLVDALSPRVDIDEFLTFWAMEVVIGHGDGYAGNTNNFYVYDDPTAGKFQFLTWGIDSTFVDARTDPSQPASVMANGVLAWRLYKNPPTRDRYVARMRELCDTVWDSAALLGEIDRMRRLIAPIADPDGTSGWGAQVDLVRAFVRGRKATILAELDRPPAWDKPLRGPPCLNTLGNVHATFATTWGTWGAADPLSTGTGTLDGTVRGRVLSPARVGSMAGRDVGQDGVPHAAFAPVALMADGTVLVVYLAIAPGAVADGATFSLDFAAASGAVLRFDPSTPGAPPELVGLLLGGTLSLDRAAATDGAVVRGSVDSPLVESTH